MMHMQEQSCISGSHPHASFKKKRTLKKKKQNQTLLLSVSMSTPKPVCNSLPLGHGNRCSNPQSSYHCSTSSSASGQLQELLTRPARCQQQAQGYFTQLAQGSRTASLIFVVLPLLELTLPKWWVNMTQLIRGNLTVQVQPFKKHLRQHHRFYVIKCQITGNTFLCILMIGFTEYIYLSHCCIMDISFIISCRSDSTGTCLIATT